jgi:serine/threonine-protein kinase
MGTVYLARLSGAGGFERLVAIKRAHATGLAQRDTSERFLREARLLASVHHANVVGIHQVGSDQDGHYLACDYVEGEALDRLIEGKGQPEPLPIGIALRIVLDALSGLHAAHETVDGDGKPLGILHRDVSIENLLVGRDGVTRLTDFGIAKSSTAPNLTDAGTIHGKLMYLTPEYLQGAQSERADDTYALGVTFWIALAGAFPYRARDNAALTHEVLSRPVPALSTVGVSVGPLLEACFARALSRDPERRFRTAREMLDALEDVSQRETRAARHLDVADFVERVAGAKLLQRRANIQAARSAEEAVSPVPQAPPVSAVVFDSAENITIATSLKQTRSAWWLLAPLLALVVLALWLASNRSRTDPEQPAAASREGRPTATAPLPIQVSPPEASAPGEVSVSRHDGTSEEAGAPVISPVQPSVANDTKSARPRASARVVESARERHKARPNTPLPQRPALEITTDNPYR